MSEPKRAGPVVFMEDWAATYGPAMLIDPDAEVTADAELVEDGPGVLAFHDGTAGDDVDDTPIAFVDGVRRGEGSLYLADGETFAAGVAGAHGVGAVVVDPGEAARFDRCVVTRMVIFGTGQCIELPEVPGGYRWVAKSTPKSAPKAPLDELQLRMRASEGRLAEDLCGEGYLTIVDGSLNFVRSRDEPVVGLVKTHHRPLLPPAQHAKVADLAAGQRTSLFRLGGEIYSAYVRLAPRNATSGPWAGVVRIEIPATSGMGQAVGAADRAAGLLPRFAGIPHIDPRAPQNLQPTGALEGHLRHLLGDAGLAARALRAAVTQLATTVGVAAGDDAAPPAMASTVSDRGDTT